MVKISVNKFGIKKKGKEIKNKKFKKGKWEWKVQIESNKKKLKIGGREFDLFVD